MNATKVIDISHYQADPDWSAIKLDGVLGVILKCTQGITYIDPTWRSRATSAMANGLKVATYHYLEHGDVENQMAHYVNEADAVMPLGSRVVIDFEDTGLTQADLELAVMWLQEHRDDLQITVYGASSFLHDHLVDAYNDVLSPTSLWVARYSDQEPYFPTRIWSTWSLWQFTDSGSIGNLQPVDCNRWNGSDQNLLAWFGPASQLPVPGPEPAPPPRVDVNVWGEVSVSVWRDGVRVYP